MSKIETYPTKTLGQRQRLFTYLAAKLITYSYEVLGEELSFGDAYRDPRAYGEVGVKKLYSSANSAHKSRLALDLNIVTNGVYEASEGAHRQLGEYWKGLHPLCRWGGDFKIKDFNHYSMEWQGRM